MTDLTKYFLTPQSEILQAIEVIDRAGAQIALVVAPDFKLLGTITDGDIRRALLRGMSLNETVAKIMNKEFKFLNHLATDDEALRYMQQHTLHQLPTLNQLGVVTHLFLLDDLIHTQILPNYVLIMAGGEGKRLRPLTMDCPKPMLKVSGKPLLEIIMLKCIDAGFQNFYFAVNYLKHQIQDYFQDGSRWGVSIKYLEESKPLGTAGALSLLPEDLINPILVLNGDVLTRVDYKQLLNFHADSHVTATVCTREHGTQIPYGIVRMHDLKVLSIEEKPFIKHYINSGIYVLDSKILKLVPKDSYMDMPQLLEVAIKQSLIVNAFPIHEYWLDIGHPETLERAHGEWN